MRISTSTMNSMVTNITGDSYSNYAKLLEKVASGKNFTKMSENVSDGKKLIKVNDELAKLNEYQSNINVASSEMSYAYDILNGVNDEILRINDLTIEAANATTTPESATAIGAELKERITSIVDLMNSKYLDNYIFSGANTQSQTYSINSDTGEITYNGSSKENGDRKLTIADDTTFSYNTTADKIFDKVTVYNTTVDPDTGAETTTESQLDFFDEMNDLVDLLNQDELDYDAIRSKLTVISKTQENISKATGEYSSKVSKLDTTKSINENSITSLEGDKSEIEDIDITSLATELANAQYSMQASYSVSSQVLNSVSLLDYI